MGQCQRGDKGERGVGARLGFGVGLKLGRHSGFAARGMSSTGGDDERTHRSNTAHQSEADAEETYFTSLKVRLPLGGPLERNVRINIQVPVHISSCFLATSGSVRHQPSPGLGLDRRR
jgi:hypothetical protein